MIRDRTPQAIRYAHAHRQRQRVRRLAIVVLALRLHIVRARHDLVRRRIKHIRHRVGRRIVRSGRKHDVRRVPCLPTPQHNGRAGRRRSRRGGIGPHNVRGDIGVGARTMKFQNGAACFVYTCFCSSS